MAGTARKIRVVGDPVLGEKTRPVTEFDDALAELIDDMFASMYVAEGVGRAAPQIGVDLAVFVYDIHDAQGRRHVGHLCNPAIVATAGPAERGDEGCLSVPGPYHELTRPYSALARGVDKHGTAREVTGTGYMARCLMHETDHLSGILYIDHLPRNQRRRVLRDMEPFEWNAPVP